MRSYDIVRQPLQSVAADVLKRAAPECRYVVLDGEGRVVLAGQVALASASFLIDLSGKLAAGQFTLLAEIIVNGNAMNAEIKQIPLVMLIHSMSKADAGKRMAQERKEAMPR